jgi:thioredoxin-dependent peroxiredoxin
MGKLNPGDPAPELGVKDAAGKEWNLADLRGKKVILYFYPVDDTPGCTAQACDFRDSQTDLQQAGYVVLGISPQGAESHDKFTSKYNLNFPLLIDEDHAVAERYGVWGEMTKYGHTYVGLNRSTFIIDEEGRIQEAQYGVKAKGHVNRLRETLGV